MEWEGRVTMIVTAVHIRNFRGIKSLDLELGQVTVLIGENNSGKTSVLDALKLCLRELRPGRRVVFDGLDFHLPDSGTEPSSADPIQIEVVFSDQPTEPWSDALVGRLFRAGILQVDEENRNNVRLRVTGRYDPAARDFSQEWEFLDKNGNAVMSGNAAAPLAVLQGEVRYY